VLGLRNLRIEPGGSKNRRGEQQSRFEVPSFHRQPILPNRATPNNNAGNRNIVGQGHPPRLDEPSLGPTEQQVVRTGSGRMFALKKKRSRVGCLHVQRLASRHEKFSPCVARVRSREES